MKTTNTSGKKTTIDDLSLNRSIYGALCETVALLWQTTESQALQDEVEACVAVQPKEVGGDANLETDANGRQLSSSGHIDGQGQAEQELNESLAQTKPRDEPVVALGARDDSSVNQGGPWGHKGARHGVQWRIYEQHRQ